LDKGANLCGFKVGWTFFIGMSPFSFLHISCLFFLGYIPCGYDAFIACRSIRLELTTRIHPPTRRFGQYHVELQSYRQTRQEARSAGINHVEDIRQQRGSCWCWVSSNHSEGRCADSRFVPLVGDVALGASY